MLRNYITCCTLGLMILLTPSIFNAVSAQKTDSVNRSGKRFRLNPLPVIINSPETGFGYGALLASNFETVKVPDYITKTSYLQTSYIRTVNNQYALLVTGRAYTPKNRDIIQVLFNYAYFPEFYFGYQTETPMPLKDLIQYNRQQCEIRYYRQVRNSAYAGIIVRYNNVYNVHSDATGSLDITKPPGYSGYSVVRFAPAFSIDRRDNQIYPRKGFFLEAMFLMNPSTIDNPYNFTSFKLDARKYFPIGWLKNDVLAMQALCNLNSGNVPFKDMADIGGSNTMRGYYTGYYRYKNLYAFQVEYRATPGKRLGFVAWGGFALMASEWVKPFENPIKPNFGIGLRLMVNQKDKLNIRFDQGFGNQGQAGSYIDITEAY